MTEPLKIGGVKFSKTEVAKKEVKTKEKTSDKGTWEQYKQYTVTLKDGTKVVYTEQPNERQAAIDIQDAGSINFYGLEDATIKDTEKDDTYRLMGCKFTNVIAKDDGILGFGKDKDKINTYNREMPDGTIQGTKGNRALVNEGDKINGQMVTDYKAKKSQALD